MSKITLENMEFHAFHGCLDHEKTLGNTFLVTLTIKLDTSLAGKTDNLNDTLNYQEVYDVVKMEMQKPSKLIEHVGQRILDAVFEHFPVVQSVRLKLSKLNPPLGAKLQSVSIQLKKDRKI